MGAIPEVIEVPLTYEALAEKYRELCADPRFANLPGKIELDLWGRILMSPASNYHGMLQSRLSPQSRRFEFFGIGGSIQHSGFAVELAELFG